MLKRIIWEISAYVVHYIGIPVVGMSVEIYKRIQHVFGRYEWTTLHPDKRVEKWCIFCDKQVKNVL